MSVTCGRSVVFSSFLHHYNWPTRYNWNIVEIGVKIHSPNPRNRTHIESTVVLFLFMLSLIFVKVGDLFVWKQIRAGFLELLFITILYFIFKNPECRKSSNIFIQGRQIYIYKNSKSTYDFSTVCIIHTPVMDFFLNNKDEMNNKSINIIKFKIYQSGWGKVHEYQTQISFLYKLRIFEFWLENPMLKCQQLRIIRPEVSDSNVLLDIFYVSSAQKSANLMFY